MSKIKRHTTLALLTFLIACQTDNYKSVGDIPHDNSLDETEFKVCNENRIKQYYVRRSSDTAPSYKGEKGGMENEILSKYTNPENSSESGYLTIRFLVNCKGEAGRFRMEEMDFNYKSKKFDKNISNQLLNIVKDLDGWIPRHRGETTYDYYQYLTFKIEQGQITKILP